MKLDRYKYGQTGITNISCTKVQEPIRLVKRKQATLIFTHGTTRPLVTPNALRCLINCCVVLIVIIINK